MYDNQLFSEFEPVSTAQWHTAIEKFLKGRPIESLDWNIDNNLSISPLHRAENTTGEFLQPQRTNNDWRIEEIILVTEVEAANKLALETLQKGANALQFVLTEALSTEQLNTLLKDILLDLVQVHFEAKKIDAKKFYESLISIDHCEQLDLSIAFSAIDVAWMATICANHPFASFRGLNVMIGNDVVKDLAIAINTASQLMTTLLEKGVDKETIVKLFRLEFTVKEQYFVEIARLRAFRRLWLALLEAYEYEKAIYPYLAVQTTLSETKDDQYWNMISSTTQAMSAAVAGANSIAIVPSSGVKESDEFTRRIARNVHHLLISESFMNRVVDPSAGSYYIENITQDISVSAWQTFCVLSK